MTDPSNATSTSTPNELQPSSPGISVSVAAEHEGDAHPNPPFAPIYTLVTNASTRTTHHPHVHYIFSDDDPDTLSQALAQQHELNADESTSDPKSHNRTVLLDVAPDVDGGYKVSWATSLSPSWAVVDAQLTRITPPSEADAGNTDNPQRSDRLMLRIDGIEGASTGTEGDLRLSNRSGQVSGSGSSIGSSQRDKDNESYSSLVDEFERRMVMLRKMVDSSEERRQKVEAETTAEPLSAIHHEFSVTESA